MMCRLSLESALSFRAKSGANATASRGTRFWHPRSRALQPERLVQGFGLEGDVGFTGGFFLRVFLHPGFPAFAGGCVASGEG